METELLSLTLGCKITHLSQQDVPLQILVTSQCSVRTDLLAIIQALLDECSKDFSVCYNILQTNGGDKDSSQMILPVENRSCPPALERERLGALRKWHGCTWNTCRLGKAALPGMRRWTRTVYCRPVLHLLLSFSDVCSTPGTVHFHRSNLYRTMGSQWRLSFSPSLWGAKLLTHPIRMSHWKFSLISLSQAWRGLVFSAA